MSRWRDGKLGQSLIHAGEQFDLLLGDGLREASNASSFLLGYRIGAEALKTSDKDRVKLVSP